MAEQPHSGRVSPLELERYLLGELSADRMAALKERESSDPDFKEQVRLLRVSNQSILFSHPPARMAAAIEERVGTGAAVRNRGGWGLWAAPLVATAVVMYVALPPDRPVEALPGAGPDTTDIATDGVGGTRSKGLDLNPEVRVYRQAGGDAEQLADGALVSPGDVIQVAYTAGDQPHGVIVSIDGNGAVSQHWPTEPGGTTSLDAGAEVRLAAAWALDDAPGFERFYFVTAALPLDVAVVKAAAQDIADNGLARTALALPLQQKVQQDTLLLTKPETP